MMRALLTTGGRVLLLILPLACGGDAPQSHVVDIRGFAFQPADIQAAPGDTLIFTNSDVVPHTATARSRAWDSGDIPPGDTVRVVVDETGEYYCRYHTNMTAHVTRTD